MTNAPLGDTLGTKRRNGSGCMKPDNAHNEPEHLYRGAPPPAPRWGEAMDRHSHELTYERFLGVLKWGVIASVVALILVAWAMKG